MIIDMGWIETAGKGLATGGESQKRFLLATSDGASLCIKYLRPQTMPHSIQDFLIESIVVFALVRK
jgi:hypothetical protein